jgi:erythromycin esterase-like protein
MHSSSESTRQRRSAGHLPHFGIAPDAHRSVQRSLEGPRIVLLGPISHAADSMARTRQSVLRDTRAAYIPGNSFELPEC